MLVNCQCIEVSYMKIGRFHREILITTLEMARGSHLRLIMLKLYVSNSVIPSDPAKSTNREEINKDQAIYERNN